MQIPSGLELFVDTNIFLYSITIIYFLMMPYI